MKISVCHTWAKCGGPPLARALRAHCATPLPPRGRGAEARAAARAARFRCRSCPRRQRGRGQRTRCAPRRRPRRRPRHRHQRSLQRRSRRGARPRARRSPRARAGGAQARREAARAARSQGRQRRPRPLLRAATGRQQPQATTLVGRARRRAVAGAARASTCRCLPQPLRSGQRWSSLSSAAAEGSGASFSSA